MGDEYPTQIGRYAILGVLGKGGMGNVYKARQESLNRVVALKVLPAEFSRRKEFSQRFLTEAKAVSRLQHANIVQVYDYGEEDGQQFIVMQYVEGRNLGSVLAEKKTLPLEQVVDFSRQVLRALRYAHRENVIHRDIKPQNILVDDGGRIYVTDFGIAKMYASEPAGTKITNTGMVVGTPEYMSPEQAEGLELNQQTDLYSLGIVLYELVTGYPPFTADTPLGVAYKHVNTEPVAPGVKIPALNPCLEGIILKLLKKDRAYRYRIADEVLDDLDRVFAPRGEDTSRLSSVPGPAAPPPEHPPVERRGSDRRRLDRRLGERRTDAPKGLFRYIPATTWVLLALLLLILAFLLGFYLNRR